MTERIIEDSPVWRNSKTSPPPTGSTVLALTKAGILISVQWSSKSAQFCPGWLPYPKVSKELKKILAEQWTPEEFKGETNE